MLTDLLADKRLILTGVVRTDSIAHAVAAHAQRAGAEVLLTAFPRDHDLTAAAAADLPRPAAIVDVDVTDPADLDGLSEHLRQHWGQVDGALHAIGFAPRNALGGDFLTAPFEQVSTALHTSAYSYAALARIVREFAPPTGAALVGLDFDAAAAWPVYNWMGVAKAALESVNRYLARDLGPARIRANLIAAGPLHTRAAGGIPDFARLLDAWDARAPLTWDSHDAAPVAETACFLLSDHARAITGEIVHVDGGYHAMAANLHHQPAHPNAASISSQLTTGPTRPRLIAAFDTLTRYGITALPAVGTEPSTTRTRLRAAILQQFPDDLGSYVFYTAPEDARFDTDGNLRHPITLHVSGDEVIRAVHAALDQVGLRAVPGDHADTLVLTTNPPKTSRADTDQTVFRQTL